jgi:hypothetical protein
MAGNAKILYCHCAYAQVIPPEIKQNVLRNLCENGASFEAVADLCEMSARRDPAMKRLSSEGPIKILACYPRAVKGLFKAANAPLSENDAEILNQRVLSSNEIADAIARPSVEPNLKSDSQSES